MGNCPHRPRHFEKYGAQGSPAFHPDSGRIFFRSAQFKRRRGQPGLWLLFQRLPRLRSPVYRSHRVLKSTKNHIQSWKAHIKKSLKPLARNPASIRLLSEPTINVARKSPHTGLLPSSDPKNQYVFEQEERDAAGRGGVHHYLTTCVIQKSPSGEIVKKIILKETASYESGD